MFVFALCYSLIQVTQTVAGNHVSSIKDVPIQKPVATGINRFDLLVEESLPQQVKTTSLLKHIIFMLYIIISSNNNYMHNLLLLIFSGSRIILHSV